MKPLFLLIAMSFPLLAAPSSSSKASILDGKWYLVWVDTDKLNRPIYKPQGTPMTHEQCMQAWKRAFEVTNNFLTYECYEHDILVALLNSSKN